MKKLPPLHLAQALGHDAADKRIDILRRIGEAGSISEAARGAGVSYKAAWQAIETLGNLAGQDLVEKTVGGSGGGGAQLTAAGVQLLRSAELMAQARAAVLAHMAAQARELGPPGLMGLGLRTSLRNQLPCTVRALKRSGGAIVVELALPDASALSSRITRESAELLGLQPGQPVIALFKATAVAVSTRSRARPGLNRLHGVVTRAAASRADTEASLKLASGLQVVGFAAGTVALRVGQSATACVDASAVAIAAGA